MLFSPTTRSFTFYTIACIFYGTLATLPSAQGAPQLVPIIPVTPPPVLDVNLGVRALVGDPTCPASNGNGLTGRVFAAVTLAERATVSALNVNLANIGADVRTCICVNAGVAVGNIVPSTSINAQALADIRAAAQATAGLSALNTLLGVGTNVLNVNLVPTAASAPQQWIYDTNNAYVTCYQAVTCGNCAANQYPGCSSGTCTCINCPAGQFYSASRGVCVVSASPVARARVKARSEALALEADTRCSGGNKNGNCKRSPNVLQLRQATREAIVERYNRTLTNSAARKPVRYQRLELVSQ